MKKLRLYIDMDRTICDYDSQMKLYKNKHPDVEYPQSIEGFFSSMLPIEGAIEAVNKLIDSDKYEIYILTAPSLKNPLCYTEKRLWIEKYFGMDLVENLIIAMNKCLLIGDYLIDDKPHGYDEQIHYGSDEFPNWEVVLKKFL